MIKLNKPLYFKKNNLIKDITKLFTMKNKVNLSLSFVLAILTSLFNIGTAFILQKLTNIAVSKSFKDMRNLLLFAVIYFILFSIILYAKGVFLGRYLRKASTQYKNFIFDKCLKKNVNGFNDEMSSLYTSALTNDLSIIEKDYLSGMIEVITQVALFVFGILAMIYINWLLMICVILASVIPIFISLTIGKNIIPVERKTSDLTAGFLHLMSGLFLGFSVIKSFKAENIVNNIFTKKNDELEDIKYKKRVKTGFIYMISFICSIVSELTVCGIGVYLCIIGKTSLGSVIAFIQLVDFVVQPIQKLGPVINSRKASEGLIIKASQALGENIDQGKNVVIEGFTNIIELNNVSFRYEDKYILKNIDLKFEKGKSYAVVGASGSGKTTLLKLLMGLYDNYEGSITIDNHEVRDITLDSLYNVVTIIQQNVFIFPESIKTNITMFKEFDNNHLKEAIRKSGLNNLIATKGLDYNCGENGSNLSGGEKQRVSIARALICKTPILLMDEAMSSLDTKTSHEVEKEILDISELTRVIITHKLDRNLLNKYDEIIVLKNGEIIECGNYDELIKRQSYFYSYVNITSE